MPRGNWKEERKLNWSHLQKGLGTEINIGRKTCREEEQEAWCADGLGDGVKLKAQCRSRSEQYRQNS